MKWLVRDVKVDLPWTQAGHSIISRIGCICASDSIGFSQVVSQT